MLLKDTSLQERHAQIGARTLQLDKARKDAEEELRDMPYVSDLTTSTDAAGKSLTTREFETKILKLIPDAKFQTFTGGDGTLKRFVHLAPYIPASRFVYDFPVLPERSVREILVKRRILPGIIASDPQAKALITRKDLPKHRVVGPSFDESGNIASLGRVEWESSLPAGMEEVKIPGREIIRGWRTVLVLLRHAGYLTPGQIEAEFGADNTAAWSKHMGKQEITLPW